MAREGKKNYKKINKTLVYYRTWWERNRKDAYSRRLMGGRLGVINTGNVEIRIRIYRSILDRKTINYVTKYMYKKDEKHPTFTGKVLCSSGIGKGYIERADAKGNKYKGEDTKETYKCRNGAKINLQI